MFKYFKENVLPQAEQMARSLPRFCAARCNPTPPAPSPSSGIPASGIPACAPSRLADAACLYHHQAGQVAEKAAEKAAVARQRLDEWDSDATKDAASGWLRGNVEKASTFLEDSLQEEPEICYVTDRLVAMGMPGPPPNTPARLARKLAEQHGVRYMIWNFSEVTYDYSVFDNQVSPHVHLPPLPSSAPLLSESRRRWQTDSEGAVFRSQGAGVQVPGAPGPAVGAARTHLQRRSELAGRVRTHTRKL